MTTSKDASQLKALLDCLDPMAMMEAGGDKKAAIAVGLLEKKCEEAGAAAAIAGVRGSVRLLLQTALLHPEASLRTSATAVLRNLARQHEPAFVEAAFDAMLPRALNRMLAESDRRVKPEQAGEGAEKEAGKPEAVDPDLPKRRLALEIFDTLVRGSSDEVAARLLASDDLAHAPLELIGNSDAAIRRAAAALLHALLASEGAAATLLRETIDEVAEPAAPIFLTALADVESDVRSATRRALLLLRPSAPLRSALLGADAEAQLRAMADEAAAAEGSGESDAVSELRSLSEWASGAGWSAQAPTLS